MAKASQHSRQFRAVTIKPDSRGCCEAARAINGNLYLLDEAPLLPLDTCDRAAECKCKYEKWDDRRQDDRRRIDMGIGIGIVVDCSDEKRSKRRRKP